MKLLKKVVVVLSLMHIGPIASSDEAAQCALRKETFELLAERAELLRDLPYLETELYKQYPNPDDPEGKEVHRLFLTVPTQMLKITEKRLELARKDPWLLLENNAINAIAGQGLTELSPEDMRSNASKLYCLAAKKIRAYKRELDRRHPACCSSCISWRYPLGRCRIVRQHYEECLKPIVEVMAIAAVAQSNDPEVYVKAEQLAVKVRDAQALQG